MNKAQFIKAPNGEDMVLLSRADYEELIDAANEAAEDAADVAMYDARMADPQGLERMPVEISRAMMDGASLFKAIRLYRGTGQVELAKAIGSSQGFISDLENRRRKMTTEVAEKLAVALDVPVHWLI